MRGFTLIEILVVLVIAGLVAGVALPRLYAISQRYEAATHRKRLLSDIGNLGYRAYVSGAPLVLTSLPSGKPEDAAIELPSGWRLDVAQPIVYTFNGICNGGKITLIGPDSFSEELNLVPPLCKPMVAR